VNLASKVQPIHSAAALCGCPLTMNVLLSANADINAKDGQGHSPLMVSSYFGQPKIAAALMDSSADINTKSKIGMTAAHLAGICGKTETLELLLNRGVPADVQNDLLGASPLQAAACFSPNPAVIPILIKAGAWVDRPIATQSTACAILFAACRSLRKTGFFAGSFADPDLATVFADFDGSTGLIGATCMGNVMTVAALVENLADVEKRNAIGLSALQLAELYGHPEIHDLIVKSTSPNGTSGQCVKKITSI